MIHEGSGPIGSRELSIQSRATSAGGTRLEVVESGSIQGADGVDEGGYMGLKKRWSNAFECEYLQSVLKRHSGNVSAAAREAKLDRSNFLRLLRRHALKAQDFRKIGSVATEVPSQGSTGNEGQQAA